MIERLLLSCVPYFQREGGGDSWLGVFEYEFLGCEGARAYDGQIPMRGGCESVDICNFDFEQIPSTYTAGVICS